ncbi:MAG: hypothetical protein F6J98_21400 [Moorea sp. SIO4G2]|uniref:hypothetical protein n=1 Tax=unclassified Moorena TaxID=2683338 RepID=UPI0013FC8E47|nr:MULTISPECIES: hypothetical protein [unclassified Moorena]NEO11743.1 hypothetical protein [Moorena sp. SIO3E8]NEO62852.1 hypothetical protein [Moorena sp. SIO4G2]
MLNRLSFRAAAPRCTRAWSASQSYRKDSGAFMVGRLCIKEVRPVANLIRLAMQRGLGGSPHSLLHQDKESAPLVKTL